MERGGSSDLKPEAEVASLDLERLELVKPISLTLVNLTQLKAAGLWVRPTVLRREEDSESVSLASTGI